jgi:serine/threonine-protein kinase
VQKGQTIADRYRLDVRIGRGGMAEVWRADDLVHGGAVALKVLHSEIAKNAELSRRFAREAKIAARLDSPYLVKMFDEGQTDDGRPFLTMELLEGESVKQTLKARGRLSQPETVTILWQVGRALEPAHALGLVHRDLKPDNVFLSRTTSGQSIVKVLDFGVAKCTDVLQLDAADPTRTGAILGTPHYMSPEQARGLRSIDFRADLWSLGVVAFECLTGQLPFGRGSIAATIANLFGRPIPMPSSLFADAGNVDGWMARALAREPAQRFSSARELIDELERATGYTPVLELDIAQGDDAVVLSQRDLMTVAIDDDDAATQFYK